MKTTREVAQEFNIKPSAIRQHIFGGNIPKKKTDSVPTWNINIQNSQVIIGYIQDENVQTGDYARINKNYVTEKEKKGIIRKLLGLIAAIVIFLAALLTCLYYLGWLEPFKEFISGIFLHN